LPSHTRRHSVERSPQKSSGLPDDGCCIGEKKREKKKESHFVFYFRTGQNVETEKMPYHGATHASKARLSSLEKPLQFMAG
jgi:hypothetical protein